MEVRRYGSYELESIIGEGGMGSVWRARHVMLDRPAALKLIRGLQGGRSAELVTRFEREVRATAALRSPHTVAIYDYGVTSDGVFYYAMELLEGTDLDTLVKQFGPMPAARVIAILAGVLESLAEAHAAGLVHRDIKPANLFLCRLGRRVDFVKVLDFGLVKGPDSEAALTRTGATPGSPAYMAPEVVEGGEVDGRTDLYSLGCVAYTLLTGRRAFERDTVMQTLLAHVRDTPTPLSELATLPPGLEALLMRCLAKSPADRPPSAAALAEALAALVAESPWTAADAEAWWSAHRPGTSEPVRAAVPPDRAAGEPPDAAARARALDVLRKNFVHSGIDFSELELRTELVGRARSPTELAAALVNLPVSGPPLVAPAAAQTPTVRPATAKGSVPEAPVRAAPPGPISRRPASELSTTAPPSRAANPPPTLARPRSQNQLALFGATHIVGVYVAPEQLRSVAVFGGSYIDLRLAVLPPGVTEIRCLAVFGGIKIIVPPEVNLDIDGIGVFGGFGRRGHSELAKGRPTVRVTGLAVFGGVDVFVKARPDTGGRDDSSSSDLGRRFGKRTRRWRE